MTVKAVRQAADAASKPIVFGRGIVSDEQVADAVGDREPVATALLLPNKLACLMMLAHVQFGADRLQSEDQRLHAVEAGDSLFRVEPGQSIS